MRSNLLHDEGGQRTFVVVLESGDEAMAALTAFVRSEKIGAAQLSGIGALSEADLSYFDWQQKSYKPIPVREQVEVASLSGDVAISPEGTPALHIHAVLGRRDGTALAGHLARAQVRPTLEILLTEQPGWLRRQHDPESGLALIRPDQSPGASSAQADSGDVEAGSLIAADSLVGASVFNTRSEKLGTLEHVMIDKASGQAIYAVLSSGGFLGIGQSYHPLPWSALRYDRQVGGYVADLDKSMLQAAPYFERLDDFRWTEDYRRMVDRYYGARPARG